MKEPKNVSYLSVWKVKKVNGEKDVLVRINAISIRCFIDGF